MPRRCGLSCKANFDNPPAEFLAKLKAEVEHG